MSFFAFRASAIEPATRSALILYDKPSLPTPIGAITGIKSRCNNKSITETSILSTSPTWPRSIISEVGSILLFNLFAVIRRPSYPVKPIELPPCWLIRLTIPLLTKPPRTISTASIVSLSVTRIPSTNLLSLPSFSRVFPI